MLNYKRPAFWVIVAVVTACVIVAVCFLTNAKGDTPPQDIFGCEYTVASVDYASGMYSFSYTPEIAPDFRLTDDNRLMVLEDKSSDNWLNAGMFEEIRLTSGNFDSCFLSDGVWSAGSARALRHNNKMAWRLLVSDAPDAVFYYLLLQENGDVYLTYGYYNPPEADDYYSDYSTIRWVFRLKEA